MKSISISVVVLRVVVVGHLGSVDPGVQMGGGRVVVVDVVV